MPYQPPLIGGLQFSRFAARAGLVTLRQTFVRRGHATSPCGAVMTGYGTSSALNSEPDLASIPMAQGGLSRLAIARLESAGVPVAPLLKRAGLAPEVIAKPEAPLSVPSLASRWRAVMIRAKSGCYIT
jgi:hypothetical protein